MKDRDAHILILFILLAVMLLTSVKAAESEDDILHQVKLEDLGRSLFFDVNLSLNRSQACGSCHDPAQAFIDRSGGAVSLGDDGISLGDRNAPTASYAKFSPPFHLNEEGEFFGGQFWDGRESDLEGQAGVPPLNPMEMGMPDKLSVVRRLQESPVYEVAFRNLFGEDIFDDEDTAYGAMASSIATFERSDFVSPFDSRYDRYLHGDYELTEQEELGMTLFFSEQFTNCNQCHQLNSLGGTEQETFTNYSFGNIGVPVNTVIRDANGLGPDYIDHGLLGNPAIDDPAQDGKFKVSTLRNVAITAPYMHNGIFQELRTVMLFYNKYNSRGASSQINPETGELWGEPEVVENIALEELESGPALDDERIDALVAFMKILTDRRYEHLLDNQN